VKLPPHWGDEELTQRFKFVRRRIRMQDGEEEGEEAEERVEETEGRDLNL
jgi:hypothetical protein